MTKQKSNKPKRESANGPVTKYQLSEEELAKYRAMKPPKKEKRPIINW